eukprot:14743635-Alexandrium_andersonii.AAC.1
MPQVIGEIKRLMDPARPDRDDETRDRQATLSQWFEAPDTAKASAAPTPTETGPKRRRLRAKTTPTDVAIPAAAPPAPTSDPKLGASQAST